MTINPFVWIQPLEDQARRQFAVLEKEIGFDIKVIKGTVRRAGVTREQDAEALHAQLASIRGWPTTSSLSSTSSSA